MAAERSPDADDLAAAVQAAQQGRAEGGIPIGAALVVDGTVLATGWNKRVQLGSAIRHGETDCLENAGRLLALGATRIGDYHEWGAVWTTLADVEGNEFCVVQRF